MYKLAIIGVDRITIELLNILSQREFPISEITILSNEDDAGKKVTYEEEKTLWVKDIDQYDFDSNHFDFVFSCGSIDMAQKYAEKLAQKGSIVIDSTGAFIADFQVPIIIPEVNLNELLEYRTKGIISSPNSVTTMLLLGTSKLHYNYGIKRMVISTYQSVAEIGESALNELFEQTRGIYANQSLLKTKKNFSKQIAFNVIPQVGEFHEDEGSTLAENTVVKEIKRILNNEVNLSIHCTYVPVFIGNSMSLNIEFDNYISKDDLKSLLQQEDYLGLVDFNSSEGYVTPAESLGEDKLYISRIREDSSIENTFNMWLVGDNLRVGITINMVKIAEEIIKLM